MVTSFSNEEDKYIQENFNIEDDKDIAEKLHKTESQIKRRRYELGLKRQRQTIHKETVEGMKWCWRCEKFHPLDEFSNNKNKKDGKQDECKMAVKKARLAKKDSKNNIELKEKKCKECSKTKSIKHFIKNVSTKDGYSNQCVDCLNKNVIRKYKNSEVDIRMDKQINNQKQTTGRKKVYKDVYGNKMKIDEEKVKDLDIASLIADAKDTNKSIENIDYNIISMELESNVDMFVQNIIKYIDIEHIYKLKEIDYKNKYNILLSVDKLEKTIHKIKNILI